MTHARHPANHRLSRLAALLGVFAVLLRCVIAPGLMPDLAAAAHGTFQLVICSGTGAKGPADDHDGGSPPGGHKSDSSLCPYAAFGHVATAAEPIGLNVVRFEPAFESLPGPRLLLPSLPRAFGARAPPRFG